MRSRILVAPLLLVVGTPAFAEVSGEGGRSTVYWANARMADDSREDVRFSVELEPVGFQLTSVEGRYKLIRLRVENATRQPLVLSRANDHFEAVLPDAPSRSAILDLRTVDSTYWDALDASTRERLAYPERIEAGQAPAGERVHPEVVYLYLFLPAEGFTTLPQVFVYEIASLSQTIELRVPETAARN